MANLSTLLTTAAVALIVSSGALAQDDDRSLEQTHSDAAAPVELQPWPIQHRQMLYWRNAALNELCRQLNGRFSKRVDHAFYTCALPTERIADSSAFVPRADI